MDGLDLTGSQNSRTLSAVPVTKSTSIRLWAVQIHPSPAGEPSRGVRRESAGAKRVEEVFRWLKTAGGGRKLRYRGVARNGLRAEMALAAYKLPDTQ